MNYTSALIRSFFILLIVGCDPLVTEFSNTENPKEYTAKTLAAPPNKDTLTVVTWNIRFGIGRANWFGDSCGDLVLFDDETIKNGLELLALQIAEMDADILLLQEVDVDSKRSAYIDQVQWLLDHTSMNYGVYASMWQVQFEVQVIPARFLLFHHQTTPNPHKNLQTSLRAQCQTGYSM
jgi:hypothetical protein